MDIRGAVCIALLSSCYNCNRMSSQEKLAYDTYDYISSASCGGIVVFLGGLFNRKVAPGLESRQINPKKTLCAHELEDTGFVGVSLVVGTDKEEVTARILPGFCRS